MESPPVVTPEKVVHKLYGGKVEVVFKPDVHKYYVGGTEMPSVTTIIKKGIDKSSPLMGWAVKTMGRYIASNLPKHENIDRDMVIDLIDEAKKEYRKKSETAAALGTRYHNLIDAFIKTGEVPTLDKEVETGFEAFLDFWCNNKIKVIHSERVVFSDKFKFSGTCDVLAEVNGILSIVDWKSGKYYAAEHGAQLAAYKLALEEEGFGPIEQRFVVRIDSKTGEFEVHKLPHYELDRKCFLGCIQIYNRLQLEPKKPWFKD